MLPARTQPTALASVGTVLVARRRWFTLAAAAFRIFDAAGQLVAYATQRRFRLKESLTVFKDEAQGHPLIHIQARQVLDFGARYDVTDAATEAPVGSLRRRGMASLVRDTWEVRDPQEQLVGTLEEDSLVKALLRRFLFGVLFPQTFHLWDGDRLLATFRQRFSLVGQTTELELGPEPGLEGRLALAQLVLLMAIEGREK